MKKMALVLVTYAVFTGCRSSYDETRSKPEIASPAPTSGTANSQPQVEMPSVPATAPAATTPVQPSTPTGAATTTVPVTVDAGTPLPSVDPASIAVQHNANQAELTKYNCKGTAVITDSGMDRNMNGLLEESEIQETRIDCTEVVPGG